MIHPNNYKRIYKNTLFLLGLLAYDCCLPLSTASFVDADYFNDDHRDDQKFGNIMMVDDDPALHPIGLIEEWIQAIKEENRQEREQTMRMLRGKLTNEEDVSTELDRQREWDLMVEEVDKEFDRKEKLKEEDEIDYDEEDNELEEDEEEFGEEAFIESSKNGTSPFAVLHRRRLVDRRMQSCVSSAGGLKSAVRGSIPSAATRINVCTSRIKFSGLARRTRRLQPTDGFGIGLTGGGGIDFSDRWIVLTCRYWRTTGCILDGESLSRIFYGTNSSLFVIGFRFLNGNANDTVGSGSAMTFLDNSRIILRNCTFVSNKSRIAGGAVLLHKSRLQLRRTMTSITQFVNNQAQYGGAIYSINSTIVTLATTSDSPFPILWNGNQASGSGGAIFMMNGTLSLKQTSMEMNEATDGGAGFFVGTRVYVDGMTVSDNRANKTGGGFIFHSCYVKATNINVTSNRAESDVGAILFVDSDVSMQNFVVEGNSANSTGGIGIVSSNVGFIYGIFNFNVANYDGGALTIVSSNVSFAQYTFLDNIGGSPEESNYSVTIDSSLKKNCFASNSELRDAVLDYNGTTVIEAYGNISDWCVGLITDFTSIFQGRTTFNEDISKWDTSKAETMYEMFSNARAFNQDISKWDVSRVTDVVNMFSYAHVFNQDISTWNLANVMGTSYMFYYALAFNQDISTWDISKAFSTAHMFDNAISFNQDISTWDVSKVMNMNDMFAYATSFNQDISAWDVSTVTDMSFMFYSASSFNQDLSAWNIVNVENIAGMFQSASSFNQDLCSWNSLCGSLTNTFAAFTDTSCPDTASDPVCGAGPFCFSC